MNSRELQLIDAIKNGDLQQLEKVLSNDPTLVQTNFVPFTLNEPYYKLKNPTPLHLAVYYSNQADRLEERQKILSTLIAAGADVNYTTLTGHGPLHCAAKIGNLKTLKLLISQNANLNLLDNEGRTALFYASGYGNELLVQELITEKADVTIKDKNDNTALHYAVIQNIHGPIAKILINHGLKFNEANNKQNSPLDLALEKDVFLAAEISQYAKMHKIFYSAITQGQIEEVEKLLKQPYDLLNSVNKCDIQQGKFLGNLTCSPLQLAAIYGHADIIDLFLKNHAKSDFQDSYGNTALHYAAFFGHQAAFDALLPCFEDIHLKNHTGFTVLHSAATYKGNRKMFDALVARGLSVNDCDYYGQTPLHVAANGDVAKELVALGANKSALDNFSRTPFVRAANRGARSVMRFLQTGSEMSNDNKAAVQSIFKPIEPNSYERMVNEGKALMKALKYKEAYDKFSKAFSLITRSSAPDPKKVKTITEYIEKSTSLAQLSAFPYQHNANNSGIDTLAILASKLRLSPSLHSFPPNELYDCLKEFCEIPLLRAFLDYVAMNFLLNDKAHIRIVGHINDEDTEGFFTYSNIVAKAASPLKRKHKGTLMHEIMHFYFNKAYQNISLPYFEGDQLKEYLLRNTIRQVLIYLYQEIDSKIDETQLTGMSTWDIGCEAASKDDKSSEIRTRFFSIYTIYTPKEELSEFIVRLEDLLGRGFKPHQLKSIQPLIDFTVTHLLPDCQKFNLEMQEIVSHYYHGTKRKRI